MKDQSKFPKFISNHPSGKDLFYGKSQERVASSIAEYIKSEEGKNENGKIPNIIGLEGNWGSGKSNLIRILKEKF